MKKYFVNEKQQLGSGFNHEVHKEGCLWMPSNHKYLGEYPSDDQALAAAKLIYKDADGCVHCCLSIHKS